MKNLKFFFPLMMVAFLCGCGEIEFKNDELGDFSDAPLVELKVAPDTLAKFMRSPYVLIKDEEVVTLGLHAVDTATAHLSTSIFTYDADQVELVETNWGTRDYFTPNKSIGSVTADFFVEFEGQLVELKGLKFVRVKLGDVVRKGVVVPFHLDAPQGRVEFDRVRVTAFNLIRANHSIRGAKYYTSFWLDRPADYKPRE